MQQRIGHHGTRGHAAALLVIATLLTPSCKKDEAAAPSSSSGAEGEQQPTEGARLVNRFVPGTPLEMRVPEGWKFDEVKPPALPPSPSSGDGGPRTLKPGEDLALMSRTMLSARAPTSKLGEKVTAWLLVQHDPWLPAGTTTTDYLDAQRRSNKQAVPDLKHVDAERSRRQGRPAYYVRDEWSAPYVGDERVTFSQETLLLIDVDEDEQLHGYSVTVTLPKDDRDELADTLRSMLESVKFGKRRD